MLSLFGFALFSLTALTAMSTPKPDNAPENALVMTVTPAAVGKQLVRVSLPLPPGFLKDGQTVTADDGKRKTTAALRVLTWYPDRAVPTYPPAPSLKGRGDSSTESLPLPSEPTSVLGKGVGRVGQSARRAFVTFPYTFLTNQPVRFILRPIRDRQQAFPTIAISAVRGGSLALIPGGQERTVLATVQTPVDLTSLEPEVETVEENRYYLWRRYRFPHKEWPLIIEARADSLGGVVVVAHLQRNLPGDGYAPDFGWKVEVRNVSEKRPVAFVWRNRREPLTDSPWVHDFREGEEAQLHVSSQPPYRLYHPAAPFKRRGRVETRSTENGKAIEYRYLACAVDEKIPMQQGAWRRAEFAIRPEPLAPVTATLESPHDVRVDWRLWDALYDTGPPLDLKAEPELEALLRYHHDATVRCAAIGDDWGNVTGYSDDSPHGGVYGMNRLNHAPPIFLEGWRSGDRRLIETAVLWCDNFYDQSIWWGNDDQRGGTRYNNVLAMGGKPPDDGKTYMWRSNSAVSFCTKGYDTFFLAYEQTGDPRMKEALEAQVRYATRFVNAGANYTRNVGDVRDFLRLYRYTGEQHYREEALRLFRDLRTQLSTGDLFTESGKPIVADPPFIDDDQTGTQHPFAKPYILGYALAGLPELSRLAPDEPKLKEVIRAVADFMAASQDPLGGWRYPHPRSSYMIVSQAIEHAWQLAQTGIHLGPQEAHLDAIERTLRQRLHGWRKTKRLFNGLTGWEIATGKITQQAEIYALYKRPDDRDYTRDYTEGQLGFGGSSPEGIVYFPEVLAFYLKHRPAARLLAPPREDEPLGKALARLP